MTHVITVKCVTVAQVQQMQKPNGPPTSPGGSVMDLSTSSVTSTSPQVNIYAFEIIFIFSLYGAHGMSRNDNVIKSQRYI